MPNTPAKSVWAYRYVCRCKAFQEPTAQPQTASCSVGTTVWLNEEEQLHNITGISGSGPPMFSTLTGALKTRLWRKVSPAEQDARRLGLATFKGAVAFGQQTDDIRTITAKAMTSKGGTQPHEPSEPSKARRMLLGPSDRGRGASLTVRRKWRNNTRPSEHARRLAINWRTPLPSC